MIFAKFKDNDWDSASPLNSELIGKGVVSFKTFEGEDFEGSIFIEGLPKGFKDWYMVDFLNSSGIEELNEFEFFQIEGLDELPTVPDDLLRACFNISYHKNYASFAGEIFAYKDNFKQSIGKAIAVSAMMFRAGKEKGSKETQEKMRAVLGL